MHDICVMLVMVGEAQVLPPIVTVVPASKPNPSNVMDVPPIAEAVAGVTVATSTEVIRTTSPLPPAVPESPPPAMPF